MPVRPRGEVWQADVQHDGRRYRATFKNQPDAIRWEAEARIALAAGRPIPEASTSAGASKTTEPTLGKVREMLLDTPKPIGWKGTRAEAHAARNTKAVVLFFGENTRLSQITQDGVEQFIRAQEEKGSSNGTINRKLAVLSKMLRFGRRREWIQSAPILDRRPESQGRLRWLTWEEQDRLVGAMRVEGQHLYADLTEFLADTGLRVGEALATTVGDTERGRVYVPPERSKNGRPREVPQTARVKAILAKRRAQLGAKPTELLWPVSVFAYRDVFERARERAGLGKEVVRHTLRHTCASRLVQAGIDIRRVMEWLGHSSLTVTMRYAHLAPDHLYEAAAALDRQNTGPSLKALDGGKHDA